jgi:beta-N-acetylhexosaminidase
MNIEALIKDMTLAEKVGQMFLLAFAGNRLDEAQILMEEHFVGAAYIGNENVPTPAAAHDLTTQLGEVVKRTRLQIPLLLGADQEGAWSVMYPGSAPGPGNMALGATGDPDSAYAMYEVIGRELSSVGLNAVFGPCADCNTNPLNAIIGMRSFGEQAELVAKMTEAGVRGAQAGGVLATLKHFPGHGDTSVDSHRGLPTVDRTAAELDAVDLYPFEVGVRAGADIVMTAHIIFSALDPDNPATLSPIILRDVLREKMGFEGVILSDSMNMMAMKKHYDPHVSAVMAFNAGIDLLMLAEEHYDHKVDRYLADQRALIQAVIDAIQNGQLPIERVNDAVRRVLELKQKSKLTIGPPVPKSEALTLVGNASHRDVEITVSRKAVAVLKNEHSLIPLNPETPIVLVNTTTRSSYEPLGNTRGIGPNQTDSAFDLFETALQSRSISYRSMVAETVLDGQTITLSDNEVIVAVTENFPLPGMDFGQESQSRIVRTLNESHGDRLIVVALRDPYDLRHFPDVATYLTSHSFRNPAAQAAVEALLGDYEPHQLAAVSVNEAGINARGII